MTIPFGRSSAPLFRHRHAGRRVGALTLLGLVTAISTSAHPLLGQAERTVALTFDDLPTVAAGPEDNADEIVTGQLLRVLAERGLPAAGFVNEAKIDSAGTPSGRGTALLEAWVDAGHTLGNHTYSHLWFYEADAESFIRDIERGERVWRPLMEERGPYTRYLRHPRLNTGPTIEDREAVERYLESAGYAVAPVTIDNYDFLFANAYARALAGADAALADRIAVSYLDYMDQVFGFYEEQSMAILGYEPGQVLLLHANRLNADHLGKLLDLIEARGYGFTTLDDALEDPAYDSRDDYVGRAGITWLHRWAITRGMPGSTFRGEPVVPGWVTEIANQGR